ncbi:MAG: hypothetical protein QOH90_337, partial [Actinomycetota bacterium]|nr:hypothetical protein [Actinomycetota bacterium]
GSPILVAMFLAALLTYWALESSHRIRTWGRWVTPWAHQRNVQPDSVTAGLARRMGYSTVAFALIVPFFLPAIGSGLLSWRSDQGGGGSGGDGSTSSGTVNPWVQLDPQDIEQSDTELMHIRASRTSGGDAPASYWRLVSLNTFADGVWTAEALDTFPVSSDGVVTPNQPTVGDNTLEQNVTIQGLRGISVPAAVQPSTIDFFRQEEAEGLVRDETGSLKLPGGLHPDLSYRVVSQIPELSFDALENARIGDPGAEYFQKPPVSPEVQALTDRWVDGAATPFQKLIALQERLRAFDYDTDQPPPDTSDYLSEFLLHDRAGFCQQFATAFALQARILGYPSRVSVGFLPGTSTESSPGEYVVRGTDAHAWPEVYFENYGWIRFEPTPRDDTVAPKYTETAKVPGGPVDTNGPGKAQGKGSTLDELDQAKIPKAFGDVGGLIDPRTGLPAAPGDAVQPTPQWVKTFTVVIQLGALLLVLFLAAVPLLKEWRTRRRYNHATGPRELAGAAFAHFEEEAADLASPRHPFETAQTFAGRLADRGKVTDRTAHRLAQLYEAAVFAPRDLQSGEGAEARELAGDLRHELWSRASWWTRFTRLFSPRSLWAND